MDNEFDVLLNVLDHLEEKDLSRFKSYLTNLSPGNGWKPIPDGILTPADVTKTVQLMIRRNGKQNSLKTAKDILCKMGQNDLVETWIIPWIIQNGIQTMECASTDQVENQDQDWRRVSEHHKAEMKKRFEFVHEGTVEGKKSKLNKMYTTLQVVKGECEGVNTDHEVMETEPQFRSQRCQDASFDWNELFNDRYVRTVLIEGVGGIGKTVCIQKFILDWAEGKSNQHFDFMFLLTFRKLNSIKDEQYSLHELLLKFNSELEDLKDQFDFQHCKVLFIFDGLDESQLNLCSENTKQGQGGTTTVETLITSLIKKETLPSANILITSRPAATRQIPCEYIHLVLEAQGFSDLQKVEYFRKNLDITLATQVIKHIKSTKSLFIMCHMPLFCWISAMVYMNLHRTGGWQINSTGFPTTLTEMLIHFLHVQLKIKHKKQYNKYEDNKCILWAKDKEIVLKLAKLALEQLDKNNFMFSKKDLSNHGIDVNEASEYSGILPEIAQNDATFFKKVMYCFVHPIIQEFLAALYVFHAYAIKDMSDLKYFVSIKFNVLPSRVPLHEVFNKAVDGALESANGHLDLFLRFLLGLSVHCSQQLLDGLLLKHVPSANSIKEACKTISEKYKEDLPPERCINLFYCLLEMKHTILYEEIKEYGMSGRTKLSPAHCSALASILLMSEEPLEEFDLRMYNTSEEGYKRLVPVVKWCKKAQLTWCKLTDASCSTVASALQTRNSQLTVLELSRNDLFDSGVELLSKGLVSSLCRLEVLKLASCTLGETSCKSLEPVLKSYSNHLKDLDLSDNDLCDVGIKRLSFGLRSQNCKLKVLRLSGCHISKQGCGFLAEAMSSNPGHLEELDVSYNHLGEYGRRQLLESPCRLKTLNDEYGGENRLNYGLRKYICELTLDPNTAHQNLWISEDNKTVKHVTEPLRYPSNTDRCEYSQQVLCKEALSGKCYWEIKLTESLAGVRVGVAYKRIDRKGWMCPSRLGENKISWSMTFAKDQYDVWHNNEQIARFAPNGFSNTVGIYLDWLSGILSFYTVHDNTLYDHLYTFHEQFTEPLYPGFRVCFGTSVSLCSDCCTSLGVG